MPKRPISDFKRKAAKVLRANTTTAEDILWRLCSPPPCGEGSGVGVHKR
jgi:hypothetical protein